ncbi:CPBP family intramembrane metalloprotease [Hymenobacter sp. BT18]|uniref:CPBP family intramembrane glutamic endopeptidase n=1 Tax=Hymenobacter sp. BT18 TaxID=2835648 RepID=UPI00143EE555|nr:type II CAAX endopeptidase family protein [Hymenobacter sp. BT18]QIX63039.1 CPBP family intramembrane metalloprotease [Hymenobacter sp. BT18]
MATTVLEPPTKARRPPAYPTIKESWAFLGWYLLVMLGGGIPLLLLCEKVLHLSLASGLVIMTVVGNLALLGIMRWQAGRRWLPIRLRGQEQMWLYVALPVLVLAMLLVISLVDLLHLPNWADKTFKDLAKSPILAFVSLCLMAPILEELLLRGVLLRGLLRNYPGRPWLAIGLSAVVFGLIHINPAQVVATALIGLVLGWLYYRTQSLWLCMAGHALNNLLAFAGMMSGKELEEKSAVEAFGSWGAYLGAVALSALVLYWLLRRIQRTTVPANSASNPGESAGEVTLPEAG